MQLYERHQKLKQQLDTTVEEWERVSMELEEVERYLLSQFFRHGFTCSLVCFKHLMTESRCLQVKCHRQILRLLFLDRPKKDIQETIYLSLIHI